MGKNIIQQRRGKGGLAFRVPNYYFQPRLRYMEQDGMVVDILKDPRRNAPLAMIKYDDKSIGYIVAPEGMKVGDKISNLIMPLEKIIEGTVVSSIETHPNSGPKLCRTSGSFGIIVSRTSRECVVQLPSKKTIKLDPKCRATLGIPGGEGRKEKPFIKAGERHYFMHQRGKVYPITSAVKMNAVDHPYGGSGHGKPRKPVSRHASPGRKVGTVSPSRTGRK